jgi:formate dehydrogenase major subunit
MGSNFAECHPVGFRWVMKAKERGCKVLHIDPRFTRTSAMADLYVAIRSGTDIAFLGGLINYILSHDRWFKDYVVHYTNAPVIVSEKFRDTEDLDGLFSGYDEKGRKYLTLSWAYSGTEPGVMHPEHEGPPEGRDTHSKEGQPGVDYRRHPPRSDPTLQHPRCVFQILKRHYARYTPERVAEICGCSVAEFERVANTLCENSGRERTSAFAYAVGWTQHTVGVQYIRAAGIVQALLGNIGRPGGGILALRGHATIQGSTDVPTLYNLLPGYLTAPSAQLPEHDTLDGWIDHEMPTTGWWANGRKYMVSLLKAWYGAAATRDNQWGYEFLPKNVGDHSHIPMFIAMHSGIVKGFFAMGQNPAVGGQNAVYQRAGLAKLDWLVVRDIFLTETAEFWKAPDIPDSSEIQTEVFFLPAATVPEMDGSFTNTQRLIQWHEKGIEPPADCRSDIWFTHHLAKRLKQLYQGSSNPNDAPFLALTWEVPEEGPLAEPRAESVLKEINGFTVTSGTPLKSFTDLKDDGSTAAGVWIYTGIYPADGDNRAAARVSDDYVSLGWGFAWPANRRILYNRASADPAGKPWSERKRYVWWDGAKRQWAGFDVPDFPAGKAPGTPADWRKGGMDAHDGASPFIMKPDGKAWLFAPNGVVDGPLPTHYEPWETPVGNALYPSHPRNPVARVFNVVGNKYIDPGDPAFPVVVTTYRLTEHHVGGAMTRWVPWLAELQPELFVELSPELAKERGIENAGWATVVSPRGAIECRALVTRRLRPFQIMGRTVHQIGMPWHWGFTGVVTGAVVNTISALVGDPNVTIHEGKAFMCQIVAGRRAEELSRTLVDPARPIPHVGRRERQAAEANIDRGIELAAQARSGDELIVGEPYLPLDQPLGVYYG